MRGFEKAAQIIRSGGVVVVATETFYALAAAPLNPEAVKKVFRMKGRSWAKPLSLIASDVSTVIKDMLEPHSWLLFFIRDFWPGSLTIVFASKLQVSRGITGNNGKIAVRVPPDCAARRLASMVGGWITATSANLSGELPPDRISLVPHVLLAEADMVIDTGPTPGGLPSTIVEVLENGEYRVLREGVVKSDLIVHWSKPLTRVSPSFIR